LALRLANLAHKPLNQFISDRARTKRASQFRTEAAQIALELMRCVRHGSNSVEHLASCLAPELGVRAHRAYAVV
jgi:hypothetical protein